MDFIHFHVNARNATKDQDIMLQITMKLPRALKRKKVEIINPEFVISIIYAAILIFIVVLWTMDTKNLSRRIEALEGTISENHIEN
jgi:hypothetical protein